MTYDREHQGYVGFAILAIVSNMIWQAISNEQEFGWKTKNGIREITDPNDPAFHCESDGSHEITIVVKPKAAAPPAEPQDKAAAQ